MIQSTQLTFVGHFKAVDILAEVSTEPQIHRICRGHFHTETDVEILIPKLLEAIFDPEQ